MVISLTVGLTIRLSDPTMLNHDPEACLASFTTLFERIPYVRIVTIFYVQVKTDPMK